MSRIEMEREHLREADRHIAEGEARIVGQEARVDRMRRKGQDTRESARLLKTMRETLVLMLAHRDQIITTLMAEMQAVPPVQDTWRWTLDQSGVGGLPGVARWK